jgi:sugar lactone lactonase YvrE
VKTRVSPPRLCSGLLVFASVFCLVTAFEIHATDIIQTVAGGGSLDGYKALEANLLLQNTQGVAVDALGVVYFSDGGHHQVLKVNPTTGLISIVAGDGTACYFGDGLPAISAGLFNPGGLAFDSSGNLFIVDRGNYVVRRVDALSGVISTVAGNGLFTGQVVGANPPAPIGDTGAATAATFSTNMGDIAIDATGAIIVADTGNNEVRKFTVGGTIDALPAVGLNNPTGVAVDAAGAVYVANSGALQVVRIDAGGVLTPVAGDGTGGNNGFSGDGLGATAVGTLIGSLGGLAFDKNGALLITCVGARRIRRVDVASATPIIITVAGAGNGGTTLGDLGPATGATLGPRDIALDTNGNLFIYDVGNQRIRRVDAITGFIDTVAGTGLIGFNGDRGPKQNGILVAPIGATFDAAGNLYIADTGDNAVRLVGADGKITTLVGTGATNGLGDGGPANLATLNAPSDVLVIGNVLFIADTGHGLVRSVDLTTKIITTYVAIGGPVALAVDLSGNLLVLHGNQVDRVDASKVPTNFIGNAPSNNGGLNPLGDGLPATNAMLAGPSALAVGPNGEVYIADTNNHRIRVIDAAGITGTLAGTNRGFSGDGAAASAAQLDSPAGVAVSGGRVVLSDTRNQRIRAVDLTTGLINTIAGTGTAGFSGDGDAAATALVNFPAKMFFNGAALVFADTNNNRIRKIITATDIDAKLLAFAAKLSFAIDKKTGQMVVGKDAVAMKAGLPLPAGITAANLQITVDIVDLHQQVQLDAKGKQPKATKAAKKPKVVQVFDFTLPTPPPPPVSKFSLSLKGTSVAGGKPASFSFASKGTFRDELGRAGFTNVTTDKAGLTLPVRVNITLGTTTFTGLTSVLYKATQGKGGAAKSVKTK